MTLTASRIGLVLFGWALTALAACSKDPVPATSNTSVPSAGRAAVSPCEQHLIKADDLARILIAPITAAAPVSGDPQSCEYLTASFPAITVSVRPGLGRSTLDAWLSGKMPLRASPLTGVGDAAAWQDTLHEVIARKGGLLCDIQVRGGVGDIAVPIEGLPAALGALCNEIFAAG